MALTGRLALLALLGAVVVALLVAAGWTAWPAVLLVDGLLLLGVAIDLTLAGGVRQLRLERTGDESVRLGEPAQVALLVTNPSGRRVRGELRDAWSPSAGAETQRHRFDIPGHERRRVVTHLLPTRRGDRRAERVTVRSYGPLGLAARQASHRVPWLVRVLPPFLSRKHLPSRLARLRELDGRTLVMVRGQGSEFDSLREYVVGDDVRSIDWRATARADDLVVRTWRPERDRRVVVVLDCGRTSAGRIGDAPRLDAAMDAALLLAALASRAGDRVDLVGVDRRPRFEVVGATAGDLLPRITNAMAPVDPELVETDWDAAVAWVLTRVRQRSLVVLLTALDPAPLAEGLLGGPLDALAHRHTVVLAAVSDPRLSEMAAGRGDATAVYEAAAAERERADRTRLRASLASASVSVVEGDPEALPPRLADAYLALKAAGRL